MAPFRSLPEFFAFKLRNRSNVEALQTRPDFMNGTMYQRLVRPARPKEADNHELVDVFAQLYMDSTGVRRTTKRRAVSVLSVQCSFVNLGDHRMRRENLLLLGLIETAIFKGDKTL